MEHYLEVMDLLSGQARPPAAATRLIEQAARQT
jgi:hypothetical protein